MQMWTGRAALSAMELLIAVGLGCVAFAVTYELGCWFSKCVDLSGLLWLIIGLPVGAIVAIGYWVAMGRMGTRYRHRLILDGIAAALVLGAYFVPLYRDKLASAQSASGPAAANAQWEKKRGAWIAALKAHAHGPPGQVPPMLRVSDMGVTVFVANSTAGYLKVALAKVLPDATVPGGYRACALNYPGEPDNGGPPIWPNQASRYILDPGCAAEFASAPIEYRVGEYPAEGWWSDSAFATPDGRVRGAIVSTGPAKDGRPHPLATPEPEPLTIKMEPKAR